jgi:NarL family two-component system response regulator LiaR
MGEAGMIRVMIVDDHPLVRDGLKMLLRTAPDLKLAVEAGSGQEALRLCETTAVDVVLMDLKMPGMGGLEATRAIGEHFPKLKVIILTSFADQELVEETMEAGAISYILKDTTSEELTTAIRSAYAGRSTISSAVAQSLLNREGDGEMGVGQDLTRRERQVLALMAAGLNNAQIGAKLVIQPSTVNFHVGNILDKLAAANRTEAVAVALHAGLID